MFSCEKVFTDFVDQLSQQHPPGAEVFNLQTRRIQRRLRFLDIAQGGCWTAPCSPAVPSFGEIGSMQSEASVIRDAPCADVHRWHDPTLFPVTAEVLNSWKFRARQADTIISYLPSPLSTITHRIRPMRTRPVDTARCHLHPPSGRSPAL